MKYPVYRSYTFFKDPVSDISSNLYIGNNFFMRSNAILILSEPYIYIFRFPSYAGYLSYGFRDVVWNYTDKVWTNKIFDLNNDFKEEDV